MAGVGAEATDERDESEHGRFSSPGDSPDGGSAWFYGLGEPGPGCPGEPLP